MLDVLILGAGASGLGAAGELKRAGSKFEIWEARDRPGGRIRTVSRGGIPVELGAEFIHGHPREFLARLDALRLRWIELPDLHYEKSGRRFKPARFWPKLVHALSGLAVPRTGDRSFLEALRSSRISGDAQRLALSFVQGFQAAEAAKISGREMKDDARAFRDPDARRLSKPISGYGSFVEALAGPVRPELRLNRQVFRVDWRRGRVEIQARSPDGRFYRARARRLIVTLPIGVLQSGLETGVRFSPPLSAHVRALEKFEMGHVVKLTLRFRSRFWAARLPGPLGLAHFPELAFHTWWGSAPLGDPVLVAWCGGDPAHGLEVLGESARIERALADLASGFGVPLALARRELIGVDQHDWSRDRFALGAYSYLRTGGSGAREALARSAESTVYFAGEALHAEKNGTVDGAWENGIRVARRVLRGLRTCVSRDTARFSSAKKLSTAEDRHSIP